MATWNSPAVARRWLAHELRTRREALGLSQSAVGRACGWSGVKVSYIENAQQKVADDDLSKLLALYDVDEHTQGDYYETAAQSRERGWWERYPDEVVPPYLSEFIGLEQGASLVRTFEPTIVPGLLQTREYMEAVITADGTPRARRLIGQVAEVRAARQEILVREHDPAKLVTVIDESVVRRVVGSASVMAAQLDHIRTICSRGNVQLYVIPFEHGISPGMVTSSHRILHFPPGVPPIVYLEARADAQWIDDGAAVDSFDQAFEEVQGAALDQEESRRMIADAADGYAARA